MPFSFKLVFSFSFYPFLIVGLFLNITRNSVSISWLRYDIGCNIFAEISVSMVGEN